jgi:hypothetical protein
MLIVNAARESGRRYEIESRGRTLWRSIQWIRKPGFTLSKLCVVSVRDLPIKNQATGWPRPKSKARLRVSCREQGAPHASSGKPTHSTEVKG